MDNVTHTLIGITLARSVDRRELLDQRIFWASVIGSNLPDLDFVAHFQTGRLGYLLHHRGLTHTFLWVPLLGLMTVGLLKVWPQREGEVQSGFFKIFWVACLALLLHIAADFCNDYGVHPFSPFWNRWFYGDLFFIIEPVLWLSMIPLAVLSVRRRWAAWFWGGLGLGMVALVWSISGIPKGIAVGVTGVGILAAILQWRWPRSLSVAFGGVGAFLSLAILGERWTQGWMDQELRQARRQETWVDFISSPAPANPFCRRLIVLSRDSQGQYIGRMGVFSGLPRYFPADQCYLKIGGGSSGEKVEHLAPWQSPTLISNSRVHWQGEYRASWEEGARFARENCEFAAFLGFARAPFWIPPALSSSTGRNSWVVGDLRYDRGEDSRSFAQFEFQESKAWYCPASLQGVAQDLAGVGLKSPSFLK